MKRRRFRVAAIGWAGAALLALAACGEGAGGAAVERSDSGAVTDAVEGAAFHGGAARSGLTHALQNNSGQAAKTTCASCRSVLPPIHNHTWRMETQTAASTRSCATGAKRPIAKPKKQTFSAAVPGQRGA